MAFDSGTRDRGSTHEKDVQAGMCRSRHSSVVHGAASFLVELPILEQFKLVKEAQVWDFIDRIPNNRQELDEYIKGSQLYDLPVLSGSGCYTLGLDEAVIRKTWISP
jgi:hypothetical protein